jgi:hypothetical protein
MPYLYLCLLQVAPNAANQQPVPETSHADSAHSAHAGRPAQSRLRQPESAWRKKSR